MIIVRLPPIPQKGAQKRKVSRIWTISYAVTLKRYEIWCQLLLVTNRKSHTGFRLVLTSMTLNGVIALILRIFSTNSIALQADYVTVVEDRPMMSLKYCLRIYRRWWTVNMHPSVYNVNVIIINFVTQLIKTSTNVSLECSCHSAVVATFACRRPSVCRL